MKVYRNVLQRLIQANSWHMQTRFPVETSTGEIPTEYVNIAATYFAREMKFKTSDMWKIAPGKRL